MIHKRYVNRITKLENNQGQAIMDHEGMESELVNYYKDLLTEPVQDRSEAITTITQHIPNLISREHNEALMRPISIEEVDQAMKETPAGKAPRPDDFTSDFFHYCWPMV
jgi:hypothetical protein